MITFRTWIVALVALLIVVSPASAQLLPKAEPAEAAVAPDPFGRTTPRSAVTNLIGALGAKDYARAANYLDVPAGRSGSSGEELARRLQTVLDSGGTLLPFAALSNEPLGQLDDDLAPELERVGTISAAANDTPILLSRDTREDSEQVWRVSRETLSALKALAPATTAGETADQGIVETNVAGAPARDWAMLLGLATISFALLRLIATLILAAARRLLRSHEHSSVYGFMAAALPPLSLYLAVVSFYIYANALAVSIVARQTLLRYAAIVAWVALAWFLLRLVDAIARLATGRMRRSERRQAVSVITLLRRTAKVLLLAVAIVAILDTIGFDVTTGIAALGIGGIALALGAQKTVENLVGSVTVIVDQPVQVGDFCRVGDVVGTVEDIGMRSTRIRTNERTIVTIPNGDFAARQIENFSKRDRFLFNPVIGVTYDTDAEQMQRVLTGIREVLAADENIIDDGARARFTQFSDSSLDIELFAYIDTNDFATSVAMREALMLKIMTAIVDAGASIAFPTRTLLVRPDVADT